MAPREFPRSPEYQQQEKDGLGQLHGGLGDLRKFKNQHIGEEDTVVREERKKHRRDSGRIFGASELEKLEKKEKNPVTVEDLRKALHDAYEKYDAYGDYIGEREQYEIDELQRRLDLLEDGRTEAEDYGDNVVHDLFKGLGNESGWQREHCHRLIERLKDHPQIATKLQRVLKTDSVWRRQDVLEKTHFSVIEAKAILQERIELFLGEETENALKKIEEFRQELNGLLPKLVEWNFISNEQLATLLRRLERTKVLIQDPLRPISRNLGDYNNEEVRIAALGVPANELRETMFHEFIHAISGRTLFLVTAESHSAVVEKKLGLEHSRGSTSVLRWLNEALTEWLAAKLHGGSVVAYLAEVQELEKMMASGLSPELFYRAYFEDADPKKEGGKSAPAFGALMQRIKEVEGKSAGSALQDHEQAVQLANNKARYYPGY